MKSIEDVQAAVASFVAEREWQEFQSPKNLSMALMAEVGELLEHFQWLTQEESANLGEETRQEVTHEMADVFIYLVRLADTLGVDLLSAAEAKISLNAIKYPVDKAKGNSLKYSKL